MCCFELGVEVVFWGRLSANAVRDFRTGDGSLGDNAVYVQRVGLWSPWLSETSAGVGREASANRGQVERVSQSFCCEKVPLNDSYCSGKSLPRIPDPLLRLAMALCLLIVETVLLCWVSFDPQLCLYHILRFHSG